MPRLRHLLENKNNKKSLHKAHWRSSTTSREVWWFDNRCSQFTERGVWIKEQWQTRCRGSRFCRSVAPCKNKTSQETEKCLRKFLEPSEKPKVIYTDNSLEFVKNLWRFIIGRENSLWETIRRTIQRSHNSIWSIGCTSPNLNAWSNENSSIWKESLTRNLSRTCFDRGWIMERRYSDCYGLTQRKYWWHKKEDVLAQGHFHSRKCKVGKRRAWMGGLVVV